MRAIPRMRLTLPFHDILRFIRNLFVRLEKREAINQIAEFERQFSARYDFPPGLCVAKARTALYLLLKHLNLQPGGEVLITAIHVADFVNMIRLAGFTPVAVDLAEHAYHVDYDDLERKITSKTVAMFITHLSGYATDMERIVRIATRHHIPLIEDCSQVISTTFHQQPLGTFGEAAIFSLSLAKPVCTLSGGMMISRNTALLESIRQEVQSFAPSLKFSLLSEALKNIILTVAVHPFLFPWLVFPLMRLAQPLGDLFAKYQKTNKTVVWRKHIPDEFLTAYSWQQAVMGLSQIQTLEEREHQRTERGTFLYSHWPSGQHVTLPVMEDNSHNTFWLFPVIAKEPDKLKQFLARHGIDSSKFLLSVLSQEEVFSEYHFTCSNAEYLKAHTLFVPMYPHLSQEELEFILHILTLYQMQ